MHRERMVGRGHFPGGPLPCAAGFTSRLKWSAVAGRYRRASKEKPAAVPLPPEVNGTLPLDSAEDLEIIEQLLALALEAISKKTPDVRLGDVLKLLEFKQRIKPEVDVKQIFWEWIG